MMLVELTQVPVGALPVAQFRDHLRLGTGFSDEGAQDSLLQTFLRAALASVEGFIGKAVLQREFEWAVPAWRSPSFQIMPTGPIVAMNDAVARDAEGVETAVPLEEFRVTSEPLRSVMEPKSGAFPAIPRGGVIVLGFTAGMGATWADVPANIAQAVLMLAAYYYEYRDVAAGTSGTLPNGVLALLGPWRDLRIGGNYR